MIEINESLSIPEDALEFTASRSSGPGGQHVNKVNSRVTLHFDVQGATCLDEPQRDRLLSRLSHRLTKDGVLQMHSEKSRSQAANRRELIERFATLLRDALRPRKKRRKTRPSRGAVQRRLDEKKRRGERKRLRSSGDDD